MNSSSTVSGWRRHSHNMNTNEVIANLANVALGGKKAITNRYTPMTTSTWGRAQRYLPTAIRLAALAKLPRLLAAVHGMADEFETLARHETKTIKSGRTHLQDAVPRRSGASSPPMPGFCAVARINCVAPFRCCARSASVARRRHRTQHRSRLRRARRRGTGAPHGGTDPLRGQSAAQMQSMHDLQQLSAGIRALALELTRIANDMRLLASGPTYRLR